MYSNPARGHTPPYREEFQTAAFPGHTYTSITTLPPAYIHGGVQGNLPHDMSKPPTQQQHRLPTGGTAQSQMMYAPTSAGPRQQTPQNMQGAFYGQQNTRVTRPSMPPMGMPQTAPMYMYMSQTAPPYGAPPTVHMVPQNPGAYYGQPQTGPRMPTLQHYPVTSSQPSQQYPIGPNTPPFYNNPSNTNPSMFFPQAQTMPLPQPQRPPSATSLTPQTTYTKRERIPLKIVDPSTGKDVSDEILGIPASSSASRHTPPQQSSGPPSARATPQSTPPPPQPQNEIAAQFAAQVAATLNPRQQQQQQAQLQAMHHQMGMPLPPQPPQVPQPVLIQGPPSQQMSVNFPSKPEAPDGLPQAQMPPKVPSPAQYPGASQTPPIPTHGVPLTMPHTQFVPHPHVPGLSMPQQQAQTPQFQSQAHLQHQVQAQQLPPPHSQPPPAHAQPSLPQSPPPPAHAQPSLPQSPPPPARAQPSLPQSPPPPAHAQPSLPQSPPPPPQSQPPPVALVTVQAPPVMKVDMTSELEEKDDHVEVVPTPVSVAESDVPSSEVTEPKADIVTPVSKDVISPPPTHPLDEEPVETMDIIDTTADLETKSEPKVELKIEPKTEPDTEKTDSNENEAVAVVADTTAEKVSASSSVEEEVVLSIPQAVPVVLPSAVASDQPELRTASPTSVEIRTTPVQSGTPNNESAETPPVATETVDSVVDTVIGDVDVKREENHSPQPVISVPGKTTGVVSEVESEAPARIRVPAVEMSISEQEEQTDADVKAMARPKNKARPKELDAKGEMKEGSEMDVFMEETEAKKTETVSVEGPAVTEIDSKDKPLPVGEQVRELETPEPTATVTTTAPTPSPPVPVKSELTEPTEEKMEKVEIQVDNRVIEENEKNEEKTNESNTQESTPLKSAATKSQESTLKYQYKEDQWSPLNLEGKKQYDRAFLLKLQYSSESIAKPDGLPNLPEVILEKPHSRESARSFEPHYQPRGGSGSGSGSGGGGGGGFDFTPGFVRPTQRGGSASMGGGSKNRSQQGRKGEKKIITSISIQQDIKLHHAEQAWKPGNQKKPDTQSATAAVEPEKEKSDDLYKRVTSILNKLTPQKFQTLLQQMTELKVDTEERLKGVIDLIFEKAVGEPGFCVAYANMCRYLMMLKVPVEGKPGEMVNFRKLLINRCQREFEKDNKNDLEYDRKKKEIEKAEESLRAQMNVELGIAETKARRRSLGNIRFIGELFKLKMLTENIMHECVLKLLKSHDEESLECLCRLLSTIGKELDTDKARPRVDQYFHQMSKIVAQKKTSSRVRFMLQDVVELRQNRWVPRRDEGNPKTIDQIHKEVAQEAQEKAILIQHITQLHQHQQHHGGRGGRGGRGDRGAGGRPLGANMNTGEEGWSTVGVRAARATIDPSKLKLSKPQHVDENIQLGPGSRFSSWGRGSSAGGIKSQDSERPTPGNRFSALSSRGEDSHDPRSRGRGRGVSPARSDMRTRTSSSRDPPRPKQGPRSSMETERQNALAAVKTISGSGRNTPPSREESRENSRSREAPREEKAAAATKEISDDELEKKTKAIMDEFLHIQDHKEAEACVAELGSPKNIHLFIATALNHVIERSDITRLLTGNFLHDLVKKKMFTVERYVKGLTEVLEYAEDIEIDIPKIWTYLAQLISPMIQDGSVSLGFLKQACSCLSPHKAAILVAEVLHDASHRLGHLKVGDLWRASGLHWPDFLPPDTNVEQFIKDKKLEFTVAEEPPHPKAKLSAENIREQLKMLLQQQNCDNEEVFDWIEGNIDEETTGSPEFIRTLMSCVCNSAMRGSGSSCKVDQEEIKKRGVLLQKYLDHQAELELQAVFSLQSLANKLEHPPGLLRSFFDILYDEDIISEDAFNQWESNKDPAEQEGKGVALKQVVQFFTWLRETEGESQEES